MPSRKLVLRLLVSLLVVGLAGALVYGMCWLLVRQTAFGAPGPGLLATLQISGWVAALCLGLPMALGLGLLIGDTLRLLIPARYERANLELQRYRRSAGADGVTEEGLRYVARWRDLGRRTSLILCLIASLALVPLLRPRSEWAAPATLVWAAALGLLMLWQRAFRCPRCGERFHGKRAMRLAPPFCTSCGIAKDSAPTDAVAPGFTEWKKWN
jgi:hypothetical protein